MTSSQPRRLSPAQSDRAAGVLLAHASGDALGAGYEFGPSLAPETEVRMIGGGHFGWEPGEWTDDTQMAVPLLNAAERAIDTGSELTDQFDEIAAAWVEWARAAADVGNQTRRVLGSAASHGEPTAAGLAASSQRLHQSTGRTAGNGSLMRTSPVALSYLGRDDDLADAARAVSELTHWDTEAGDACVLWTLAISHAVLTGAIDVRVGLPRLPASRRDLWEQRIREAEGGRPVDFPRNGWVVHAFQAAYCAITTTPVPALDTQADSYPAQHLRLALEDAVRAGGDTDTVAAIAGALLGARWGASAVPASWRRLVHGWPDLTGQGLARRGLGVVMGGPDSSGWPSGPRVDYSSWLPSGLEVPHPGDPGVVLGDATSFDQPPEGVDAVVSLCRVGHATPAGVADQDHLEVWLIDTARDGANPNLEFVLADTADAIASLRADGRTVLVHCVAAQSRTPTVAAAYAVRHLRADPATALAEICALLPDATPNPVFRDAVACIGPAAV